MKDMQKKLEKTISSKEFHHLLNLITTKADSAEMSAQLEDKANR